ncbi:DUF2202 domain-containing protein [Thermococcus alcaliphilus]|uniref:DUF2202 domain-containing protein n=1 Tax=Thermococcus alcaliphilus TaxID=139207 RepID=UPI002090E171|nr:DUF2202 domain-containing protein [Thermococcus alcaliphilus]MCO6041071.1 DUF2202 domain-containing protein [Thermococcus alcaliphilus]
MWKKILGFGFLVLALFGLVLGGVAAYRGVPGTNPEAPQVYQEDYTSYYAPLSDEEASGLIYMVEEEKLARDVYLTLHNETGLTVFEMIAESEQSHMDAVLSLIDKYNLTAPGTLDQVGVFENPELQALYDQLIEQGSQSTVDALKVGALIEETDIKDLEEWIAKTDNEDIARVYSNLMAGSENHLRAFVRNLEAEGVEYTAQVLPQEQVDEIMAGETGHSGHGKMMAGENHSHMKGKEGDRMAKEQRGKMGGRIKGNGDEKGTHEHGKSGNGEGNKSMRGYGSGDCLIQAEGA